MVIGAFPLFKLGALAVRQVAKPLATFIKNKAKENPAFRNYICMPPAQFYNWVEVKTKMWALNLGKPVSVPPLNEAMAIELGANLLGEFIIFFVGASMLILEYTRQAKNETKKKDADKQYFDELTSALTEMTFRLERQDTQIREITRVLADIESRSLFSWHKDRLRQYTPFDPNQPDQNSELYRKPDNGGIYDPDGGLLFKGLHFLESQMFTNMKTVTDSNQENALSDKTATL